MSAQAIFILIVGTIPLAATAAMLFFANRAARREQMRKANPINAE